MKLKTSFFNFSVLKKDITRFMPLWALYTIGLLMSQMFTLNSNVEVFDRASDVAQYIIQATVVPTFFYAGICAVTLFGDLFVPRMCNALHAMPMRREGWFLTHSASGLLFGLVPNLLAALVAMPMLENYYYVAFYWLGAVMLQYLFFFGLALLSVMCAGSRLGMIAIYGIINFFSLFVYALVSSLYIPLLYGVHLPYLPFEFLCPVSQIASSPLIETSVDYSLEIMTIDRLIPASWNYLFALAAIGVVLAVLAALIYRRRQLERASDFLAIPQLSPVFLLIVTLGSGMLFYLFATLFSSGSAYPFLFLGMAVGYFVGRMLLERTVRVFQLKSVLGYVLIAVAMGASLGLTYLDPLRIVTRIPAEDEIVSCSLVSSPTLPDRVATDPMEIHQIVEFHEALCQNPPEDFNETVFNTDYTIFQVDLSYELTNGKTMERSYQVDSGTETGRQVIDYLNSWQNLLGTDDLEKFASQIMHVTFSVWDSVHMMEYEVPSEDLPKLLDAIKADTEAGNLTKFSYGTATEELAYNMTIVVSDPLENGDPWTRDIWLDITKNCVNVLSVLDEICETQIPTEIY